MFACEAAVTTIALGTSGVVDGHGDVVVPCLVEAGVVAELAGEVTDGDGGW